MCTSKEIWYLSRGQEVIDEDQKLFIWDLGISEQKHCTDILQACLEIELGQVNLDMWVV